MSLTPLFQIHRFEPMQLTVENIGPFRSHVQTFSFLHHELGEPCNFYLFISQNGYGKTTLLELMAALMGMLGQAEPQPFHFAPLDQEGGRAQWDIRVKLTHEGQTKTVVLSLLAGRLGEDVALKVWGEDELAKVSAIGWHRLGHRVNEVGRLLPIGGNDDLVQALHAAVRAGLRRSVGEFEAPTLTLPTLLFFSAYRDIVAIPTHECAIIEPEDWGYAPVHRFDKEGGRWRTSLDNLLVWLKWLDDGRFEKARQIIHERVFAGSTKYLRDVRRQPPGPSSPLARVCPASIV
ncbi:MAG: ATP-binding protein [Thiobacillaceae bacterium]